MNDFLEEKRRILWQILSCVPAGKVVTYGQLATLAGLPGYARFVGATLKKLPPDSSLPWFRVINASGRISFPPGSEAYSRQHQQLQNEGVIFKNGRVSLKQYQWHEA